MAKYEIRGAKRNAKGELNEFLLNDGSWILLEQAIVLTENDKIDAVVVKSSKSKKYLRSKPDAAKANNFDRLARLYKPYLHFNNFELCWMENKQKVECWTARSGKEGYQSPAYQSKKDKGPIPEGEWYVRQDRYQRKPPIGANWIEDLKNTLGGGLWPGGENAWGKNRIWLIPKRVKITYGRSGFSIHGGETMGSAGCIDLSSSMPLFILKFLSYGSNLVLKVKY